MINYTHTIKVPQIQPGELISCKFVAKALTGNTWTCKSGPVDESDEYVIETGETVPQNVAAWMFPSFARAMTVYKR